MFRRLPLLIFGTLLVIGCKHTNAPDPGPVEPDYANITNIVYSQHIQPIFDNSCASCHAGAQAAAGLDFGNWDAVIAGGEHGEAVVPFDSRNSRMIRMLRSLAGGPHPGDRAADTLSTAAVNFLARWIDEGAKNDAGEVPYTGATDRLFVCNQNEARVSVVETNANVVIRHVNLDQMGYSPGSKPHHTAVEPNGSFWYLSLIGGNKVLKLNRSNEVVAEAEVAIPALLSVHPTEDILYVSRFMNPDMPLNTVVALKRSTLKPADNTENGEIPVQFNIPHAMAVDNAGKYVYTASLAQNQLIVIDHATKEVDEFIPVGAGKGPLQLAVSPDDRTVYLSCQISSQILVFDVSDPQNRALVDSIDVGNNPWHPGFTGDGGKLYVGSFGGAEVTRIDPLTRTISSVIRGRGLEQPHGMAISGNGYAYVSSRNVNGTYVPRQDFGDNANAGTVVIIDTADDRIVKVLEVGAFASGLSLTEQ